MLDRNKIEQVIDISSGLGNSYLPVGEKVNRDYPYNGSVIDKILYNIESKRNQIAKIEEEIKRQERVLALHTVMQFKGWQDFDVSDVVTKTGDIWMNFIGTEEEYKTLLSKINEANG